MISAYPDYCVSVKLQSYMFIGWVNHMQQVIVSFLQLSADIKSPMKKFSTYFKDLIPGINMQENRDDSSWLHLFRKFPQQGCDVLCHSTFEATRVHARRSVTEPFLRQLVAAASRRSASEGITPVTTLRVIQER